MIKPWLQLWIGFGLATTGFNGYSQGFPTKPIRLVLGPSGELVPRMLAQKLSQMWGKQVIVDPRSGGGGAVSADVVSKAPPDGYTWLFTSAAYTISASLLSKPPFDLVRDFSPVSLVTSAPFFLVAHPSVPVKTLKEVIALARAQPGALNFSSSGLGTPPHMAGEMLKSMAHVNLVHVPYKNAAAAITDNIAGQIQLSFQYSPSSLPQIQSKKLRAIAVTSLTRSRYLPELPTMDESGVRGFEITGWNGIHVPAKTPSDLIKKINMDIHQALQSPEVQERLMEAGLDVFGNTVAEFDTFVNNDRACWLKVVKEAHLQTE